MSLPQIVVGLVRIIREVAGLLQCSDLLSTHRWIRQNQNLTTYLFKFFRFYKIHMQKQPCNNTMQFGILFQHCKLFYEIVDNIFAIVGGDNIPYLEKYKLEITNILA